MNRDFSATYENVLSIILDEDNLTLVDVKVEQVGRIFLRLG